MILSDLQNDGMKDIKKWYTEKLSHKKYYTLGGIAGSGKSTLVKYVIDDLGINENETAMATYTGMAANVLLKKGNMNSSTIHRLIYHTEVLEDEETHKKSYITTLKDKEDLNYLKIIVIDECFMVPQKLVDDLLSFEVPILFVGDPEQLPPVAGGDNNLKMDFFLNEPHRQALENPILYIANLARNNEIYKIKVGKYGDNVRVFRSNNFDESAFTEADQIIAARNKTVSTLNDFYRKKYKKYTSNRIEEDEKIMCTLNNWNVINDDGLALVNGFIGKADNVQIKPKSQLYSLDFHPDGCSSFYSILVDKLKFEGREITKKIKLFRSPILNSIDINYFNEFVYAYVITTHKSQGSEFPYVTLFAEMREKRMLYTGVTRAGEKLDIII